MNFPSKPRDRAATVATPHTRATGGDATALERLVDAQTLAAYLDVSVAFVYEHAAELGARRLGSGPKARLRFSVAEVDRRLTVCPDSRESETPVSGVAEPQPRRRGASSLGSESKLLPIRGSRAGL